MTTSRTMFHIGEHITGQSRLTPAEIATFANMSGDHNPLHHDMAYARLTRFGGIIACGPQITSLMMGILATYFTRNTSVPAMLAGSDQERAGEMVRQMPVTASRQPSR